MVAQMNTNAKIQIRLSISEM